MRDRLKWRSQFDKPRSTSPAKLGTIDPISDDEWKVNRRGNQRALDIGSDAMRAVSLRANFAAFLRDLLSCQSGWFFDSTLDGPGKIAEVSRSPSQ
jgi:hypothetical protein